MKSYKLTKNNRSKPMKNDSDVLISNNKQKNKTKQKHSYDQYSNYTLNATTLSFSKVQ